MTIKPTLPFVLAAMLLPASAMADYLLIAPLGNASNPAVGLELSASDIDFGRIKVGQSQAQTVHVRNASAKASGPIFVSQSGTFEAVSNCGSGLGPNGTCEVVVTARPAMGEASGRISVGAKAGSVQLQVAAFGELARLAADSINFGTVHVSEPLQKTLTVASTGNMPAAVGLAALPTGLSLVSTTCTDTLAAGESCAYVLQYSGQVDLASELSIGGLDGVTVGLTGTKSPLVHVALVNSARQWADGTFAASCLDYLSPTGNYRYLGATGSGYYRIKPTANAEFSVYCDQVNEGGGWTLAFNVGATTTQAIVAAAPNGCDPATTAGNCNGMAFNSVPIRTSVRFDGQTGWWTVGSGVPNFMSNQSVLPAYVGATLQSIFNGSRGSNLTFSTYASHTIPTGQSFAWYGKDSQAYVDYGKLVIIDTGYIAGLIGLPHGNECTSGTFSSPSGACVANGHWPAATKVWVR